MAVLFDLDGTLIDTAPDFHTALHSFAKTEGLKILDIVDYEYLRKIVSDGSKAILKNTIDGFQDEVPQEMITSFIKHYRETNFKDSTLFPGIQNILDILDKHGIKWGVVTNKPGFLTEPLMDIMSIQPAPSCIISGDSAQRSKPHPDPMLMACKQINAEPSSCIYVGDAKRDIQAAHSCDMPAIAVEYGYIKDENKPQLWNADYLVSNTEELENTIKKHFGWQL